MAQVIGHPQVPTAVIVAVEGEEDLVVAADQPIPQPYPGVVAPGGKHRLAVHQVDDVVRGQDGRQVRIAIQHALGPVQTLVRGAPVQGHQQKALPQRRETMGLVETGDVAFDEGGLARRPLAAEILGEEFATVTQAVLGVELDDVMVAGHDAIGHPGLFKACHGVTGQGPLAELLGVFHQIAQVHHERQVQRRGVVRQPMGLGMKGQRRRIAQVAIALHPPAVGLHLVVVLTVVLGIGEDAEHEAAARRQRRQRSEGMPLEPVGAVFRQAVALGRLAGGQQRQTGQRQAQPATFEIGRIGHHSGLRAGSRPASDCR